MARPSNIDKLPVSIREAIGALRRGGRTIDEILAHIRELGVGEDEVSRSGLGRHVKTIDEIGEEMRKQRAMADALVAKFGAEPDDRLFRVNVEMMHGLLFKMNLAIREGETPELTPGDIMFLSSALKNIASASKTDTDRIDRIEKRAAAAMLKQAEAVVAKVVERRGLSAEVKADIKAEFLGIAK